MRAERYQQIGTVGKAHGLDGTVRIHFESAETGLDLLELKEVLVLYLRDRKGNLVPARIESHRNSFKRGSRSFFVKFDQFAGRSESEAFQDCPVFVDRDLVPDNSEDTEDPGRIVGFRVTDSSGMEAVVTDVLDNPAHLIIEMESEGMTFLVPWVDAYVLSVDTENRRMTCRDLTLLTEL